MIAHFKALALLFVSAIVRPAAPTFSSHSQISKAHSPAAINRLSCVPPVCQPVECNKRMRQPSPNPPTLHHSSGSSSPLMHRQLMKVSVKMSGKGVHEA